MVFLLFLPQDNAESSSDAALAVLNDGFEALLCTSGSEFWNTAQTDSTFHASVDSYLRHARYDRKYFSLSTRKSFPVLDGRVHSRCKEQAYNRLYADGLMMRF